MNNRWSFVKRFGSISYSEFMAMADQFVYAVGHSHYAQAEVTVTFYKELPHSVSAPMEGVGEWVASENKKLELAKIYKPSDIPGLPHIPQEIFERAVSVQLIIRLPLYNCVLGHMECKGLLPRHVVFYVQSNDEDACQQIYNRCVGKQRPSRLWFGEGSGFERCHPCSVS